jgi:uncharacterized protein (DUF2062 family)
MNQEQAGNYFLDAGSMLSPFPLGAVVGGVVGGVLLYVLIIVVLVVCWLKSHRNTLHGATCARTAC